jgi:hypothetical protein
MTSSVAIKNAVPSAIECDYTVYAVQPICVTLLGPDRDAL